MKIPQLYPKQALGLCKTRTDQGFTLKELVVVISTLCVLVMLVLPALGNAKVTSRQLSCMSNLRQLGVATRLYVVDFRRYPGDFSDKSSSYVWPTRLLNYAGGQRNFFSCPAAAPGSWWNTNFNKTLGGMDENGLRDAYLVRPISQFSYGINGWGLDLGLGLGGNIADFSTTSGCRADAVVCPNQMIMLGDAQVTGVFNYDADLDPRNPDQTPSNRHQYQTDMVFADGHVETPLRNDVINPANTGWRARWNTDNQPHLELGNWTVNSRASLEPSY